MGGLVTNEMKHRLEVAAQRLARRADEQLAAADPDSADGPEQVAPIERGERESRSQDTDGTERDEEAGHERTSD
jgi:uncharacterized protein YdaT